VTKRKERPAIRRHILIEEVDWEFLGELYGRDSPSKLGQGQAICSIVHRWCQSKRQEIVSRLDQRQSPIGQLAQQQLQEDPA
jgi:hypothetical protein